LEVKNGKYKYEELEDLLEKYDEKFNEFYETSPLPRSADRNKIDELCIKLVKSNLGDNID